MDKKQQKPDQSGTSGQGDLTQEGPEPVPRTRTPSTGAAGQYEPNPGTAVAKECVKKALQGYKSALTAVDQAHWTSAQAFKEHHEKILRRAQKEMRDTLGSADESLLSPFIERLNKKAGMVYESELKLLEAGMEVHKLQAQAEINMATREYNERMARHFKNKSFMTSAKLRSESDAIMAGLVSGASAAGLSQGGLNSLREALQALYMKFEERNRLNTPTESVAIGIDLGTTYCCVAVYMNGRIQIIPSGLGSPTVPSYVAFTEDEEEVVGEAAKSQAYENPRNTIFDAKRLIGRDFKDPDVQADSKLWPFDVVQKEETGKPSVMCRGLRKDPEVISAKLLKHLKSMAENYLQVKKIEKAVITVPAYFNDGQRQATKDAGYIAGLDVLQIINEPTAAAMAYYFDSPLMDSKFKNILVYDLGGGTFDVSVLEMRNGEIQVKAVKGDMHLGGEDFDQTMVEFCANKFREVTSVDLLLRGRGEMAAAARSLRRLRNECERQKKFLSTAHQVTIALDGVCGADLNVKMSRGEFEDMNRVKFQRTIEIVRAALADAKLKPEQIDEVVLVGGSTRIPKIQQMLSKFFGGRPLSMGMNPDEAVARGAALAAAKANAKVMGEENSKGNAGVGEKGLTLAVREVTPLPIGIGVKGDRMSVIVPRNHEVPCSLIGEYCTSEEGQTSAWVAVYEGEDPVACKNHLLGSFRLMGIPAAEEGVETAKVCVKVTEEGIIHVTATLDSNGASNDILIEGDRGRLSWEAKDYLRDKENRGRS